MRLVVVEIVRVRLMETSAKIILWPFISSSGDGTELSLVMLIYWHFHLLSASFFNHTVCLALKPLQIVRGRITSAPLAEHTLSRLNPRA